MKKKLLLGLATGIFILGITGIATTAFADDVDIDKYEAERLSLEAERAALDARIKDTNAKLADYYAKLKEYKNNQNKGVEGDGESLVRAHYGKGNHLAKIGAAGEYIIRTVLEVVKRENRKPLDPTSNNPLRIKLGPKNNQIEYKTNFEKTEIGRFEISASFDISIHIVSDVVDPSTEAIRKANPNAWVKLVAPKLRIKSGYIIVLGKLLVNDDTVVFHQGQVITNSTASKGFFVKGTEVSVGDTAFTYNGHNWSQVGGNGKAKSASASK